MRKLWILFLLLPLSALADNGGFMFKTTFGGIRNTRCFANSNTIAEWNGDIDANDDLIDVSGNGYTLADGGTPSNEFSPLQLASGARWQARTFDGVNEWYNMAHDAAFDVFDSDHTLTIISKLDSSYGANAAVFSHGDYDSEGVTVFYTAGAHFRAIYGSGGGSVSSECGVFSDDKYHICQWVRTGNTVKVYADGVLADTDDVTGYGVDASNPIEIGAQDAGFDFKGSILYVRLDGAALTDAERALDLASLTGMGQTSHDQRDVAWDVSRGTGAYQTLSDGYMELLGINQPRVGGRTKALLVEPGTTNTLLRSEVLNLTWVSSNVTVAADDEDFLNGETIAEKITESVDGGGTVHTINQSSATATSFTNTEPYSYSVYAKHITGGRSYVRLAIVIGAVTHSACFDIEHGSVGTAANATSEMELIADEWYRLKMSITAGSTAVGTAYIGPVSVDCVAAYVGDGRDDFHAVAAQLENLAWVSSYVPTADDGSGTATRGQERINIPTPNRILPTYIDSDAPYVNLRVTVSCPFSAFPTAADYNLLEVSEHYNINRFRIYHNGGLGYLSAYIRATDGVIREVYITDANLPNMRSWVDIEAQFDFSDLTNSLLYINGDASNDVFSNMTCAAWDCTLDSSQIDDFYIGASPNGYQSGCMYRDLRIWYDAP